MDYPTPQPQPSLSEVCQQMRLHPVKVGEHLSPREASPATSSIHRNHHTIIQDKDPAI